MVDLKPLKGLTALTLLDLSGTQVVNLKPLKGLTALYLAQSVRHAGGQPQAAEGLTALTSLDLSRTRWSISSR